MTIEERLSLLEQQIAAQVPTPTEYYTSRWSGEEIDNRIASLSNQNLLDNAYFKGGGSQQGGGQFPINQRGQTSYASGNVIDRWNLSGNGGQSLIIDTDGITLTSTAEYGLYLNQIPDQSVIDACLGKTVTVSVISVGQNTANLSLNLYVDSAWTDYMGIQEGISTKQFTIPSTANSFNFNFGASAAGACKLIACKLELGNHQTLAYQDEDGAWQLFETPDYGEELAKCRYYFRRYGVSSLGQIYLPPALGVSGTEANFSIVSEPMRIAPTISGNGFLLAGTTGDGFVADGSASFSLLGASPLSGIITVKVTCSNRTLIPGNYYTLYANPEYGAFLDLSAEL